MRFVRRSFVGRNVQHLGIATWIGRQVRQQTLD
jgi:hypothetical protein